MAAWTVCSRVVPISKISWINGPVLRASTSDTFRINEAALVGRQQLLGEVIRIDTRELVIQVYEDTTGLRPGDPVLGTGSALSVKLGPGLLGTIFDGLLRPLSGEGQYVKPGAKQTRAAQTYTFHPTVKPGDRLTQGSVFGTVNRSDASVACCRPTAQAKSSRWRNPVTTPRIIPCACCAGRATKSAKSP